MKPLSKAIPKGNHQTILLSTAAVLALSVSSLYLYPSLLHPFHYTSTTVISSSSSSTPSLSSPPPPSVIPDQTLLSPPPPPPSPPYIEQIPHPRPPKRSSRHPRHKREKEKKVPPVSKPLEDEKGNCDLTRGDWVEDPDAPYYTNDTCWMIQEHQNCMKYGRPDTGYLRWRWKPEGCQLPRFDAGAFLELVRGRKMAFVGDSLARNHMQSLMCLLSRVEYPKDISLTSDENFKRMYYTSYDFTIWIFWSPFLVKAEDPPEEGPYGLWKLHLDQVDHTWIAHLKKFDYLIISAGNWYTRPSTYYLKKKLTACNYCQTSKKIKRMTIMEANRKAFQTAFHAILKASGYKGLTFLRSLSPSHFENGRWNDGGDCRRTRPFKRSEIRINREEIKLYKDQIEEFREAHEAGRRKGLKFKLLDATQAMMLRPDGHPSRYGHWPRANVTMFNDCVHWCLPGPVDMWNDILFQMIST